MVAWGEDKPRKEKKVLFPSFWVGREQYNAFRAITKREGVPMAQVLRAAIEQYISNKEATND